MWLVMAVQFCCSAGAFPGLSYNFLSEVTPFRCGLDPNTGRMLTTAIGTLAVMCILTKLVVYFMATKSNNRHIIIDKEIELADLSSRKSGGTKSKDIESPPQGSQNPPDGTEHNHDPGGQPDSNDFVSLSCLHLLSRLICKRFFDDCKMRKYLGVFLPRAGASARVHRPAGLHLYILS
jgi:hypothetical protein